MIITTAQDEFNKLQKEEKQKPQKRIKIRKTALDEILSGFNKLIWIVENELGQEYTATYETAQGAAPSKVTLEDLDKLLRFGKGHEHLKYFPETFGTYLSVAINRCESDTVALDVSRFTTPLEYVGYNCRNKDIVINGNLGDGAGDNLESGSITINGKVFKNVGNSIRGGVIKVNGRVNGDIGRHMFDGNIEVNGNVRGDIGYDMRKGQIKVNGRVVGKGIGQSMEGGEIIVNGRVYSPVGSVMEGGVIRINGDVLHERIGLNMYGGEIYLNGEHKGISEEVQHTQKVCDNGKWIIKHGWRADK